MSGETGRADYERCAECGTILLNIQCTYCAEGFPRNQSALDNGAFVHNGTPVGRVVCSMPHRCAPQPSESERPACACAEYWPGRGHPPDCPTQPLGQALTRVRQLEDALRGVVTAYERGYGLAIEAAVRAARRVLEP